MSSNVAGVNLISGVSRRPSRRLFAKLFSKADQTPMGGSSMSSHHPYDSISLIARRDDPAFSTDPSMHHMHAHAGLAPQNVSAPVHAFDDRKVPPTVLEWHPPQAGYYTYAHSLLPSDASFTSSDSHSSVSTQAFMPASHLEPEALVNSPLAETFEAEFKDRSMSPPPEYDAVVPPELRLVQFHNDSAPELRHVEAPGLPHRSATVPITSTSTAGASASEPPSAASHRHPQAHDIDRIDELDDSNPLGVALHHEGPFEAIASVLKASAAAAPHANHATHQLHSRNPRAPKPGGSLGISPGQIFPHSWQYHQPQPPRTQEYAAQPQASTSYLRQPRSLQDHRVPAALQPSTPQQHSAQAWQQPRPPSNTPSQTQYDPIDNQLLTRDSYYSGFMPNPYSPSEENAGAYDGIDEEEFVPIPAPRHRRSAPPAPQVQPHVAPPDRRFSAPQNGGHGHRAPGQPQPPALVDPRFPQNQDQSNFRQGQGQHSPGGRRASFDDPRAQQANAPRYNLPREQQRHGPMRSASYQSAPQNGSMQQHHNDLRRASNQHLPLPAGAAAPNIDPGRQQFTPRSVQHQSLPAGAAAPNSDLGHQQLDPRSVHQQQHQQLAATVTRDRSQSVNTPPSIAAPSTATSQMRPRPHHVPKNLVMPTPLQRSAQLPSAQQQQQARSGKPQRQTSGGGGGYEAPPPRARAQVINMVQDKDGGRQLLRKRSNAMAAASAPHPPPPSPPAVNKTAPSAWRGAYMAPSPTSAEVPSHRPPPPPQDKKRHNRLSKRRTDS